MKKLKEVVDRQRDEIRAKDRELGLKNEDVEAVSDEPPPHVHPPGRQIRRETASSPQVAPLLSLALMLWALWGGGVLPKGWQLGR